MSVRKKKTGVRSERSYIIALSKWRSLLALLAGLVTASFALYAIGDGMADYAKRGLEIGDLFRYFTINSNFLTACARRR